MEGNGRKKKVRKMEKESRCKFGVRVYSITIMNKSLQVTPIKAPNKHKKKTTIKNNNKILPSTEGLPEGVVQHNAPQGNHRVGRLAEVKSSTKGGDGVLGGIR